MISVASDPTFVPASGVALLDFALVLSATAPLFASHFVMRTMASLLPLLSAEELDPLLLRTGVVALVPSSTNSPEGRLDDFLPRFFVFFVCLEAMSNRFFV